MSENCRCPECEAELPNHTTTFGDTALVWAVLKGHEATVDYLLASGANVKSRNAEGHSVLHFAATDDLYQRLWDAGASVGRAELFREGYKLALAGRYTEAAESFEQARQISSDASRSLQANLYGWAYEIPDANVTLPVLLADCYARSGEHEKARQILSDGAVPWSDAGSVMLYQRRQNSPGHQVSEQYELSRAEYDRFRQSPDQPLTLRFRHRESVELRGGSGSRGSSSESDKSGAFHN